MHICLISNDIFAWKGYSDCGYATRMLGRALVKQGIEVTAVTPRSRHQPAVAMLDGMRVVSYAPRDWLAAKRLFKAIGADIYHAQNPSFGAYLAQYVLPQAIHLLTFHCGRNARDWKTTAQTPFGQRMACFAERMGRENWIMSEAVCRTNGRFTSARQLVPTIRQTYRLGHNPEFLPTPITMAPAIEKAAQPTVCYVARWEEQDQTDAFFELARSRPDVHFIAVGYGKSSKQTVQESQTLPNLETHSLIGALESEQLRKIWQKSWILIDTADRYGLPTTFLEAAAHGCAILAASNPDEFAADFGYFAKRRELVTGLQALLRNDNWREYGAAGQSYVQQVFAAEQALPRYFQVYERLLRWQRRRKPLRRIATRNVVYRNGGNIWPWM
ncbi:MAG: glycosyltransferase family 4 protein [Chloroflexota bacterium]